MSRNYQIAQGLILPFIFGIGSCSESVKRSPEHPNILVVMTDQQSASMISCTGNKWLRTPAMDGIASKGIRFTRAYATNPVSSPSRFSLQTGRYPSEIGMIENAIVRMQGDKVREMYTGALGNVFRKGGYQTFYGGKVHMPVTGSDVNILGYELLTLDERDSLAAVCANFLMNRKKNDKPFLLFTSFINPHDICYHAIRWAEPESGLAKSTPPELDKALELPEGVTEEEFFSKYCPPLPDNHEPMAGEPCSIDSLLDQRIFRRIVREKWTEKDWRMHRWAYMRLTERVDAQIGIVLDALKKSGLQENTVVVFTSDHGDLDASHKLEHKTMFFEESTNVPFMVSYPWMKMKGRIDNEHLISNGLCLLPTLCDFAAIELPAGLTGLSVRPLIEKGTNAVWPEHIFLETETGFMVQSRRYKYAFDEFVPDSCKAREMFVDLEKDPGETVNMVDRIEYKSVIDSLRGKLINYLNGKSLTAF